MFSVLAFIIKYRNIILPIILALVIGSAVAITINSIQREERRKCEARQQVIALKEGEKSVKIREKVENETRNLSSGAVIDELRSHGWLRNDSDR